MPLTFEPPPPHSVRASRTLAVLAVAVVALLAALQAIATEAGDDDTAMLQELEAKVARVVAAGGGSVLNPSGTYSLESPIPPEPTAAQPAFAPPAEGFTDPNEDAVAQSPEPTATPEPASQSGLCPPDPNGGPFCVYTVQDGDTLWGIAELLGFEGNAYFSGAELIAMSNGINNAQNWVIVPGQELRIPVSTGVVHTVAEDQTISQLAELYGSTTEEVALANPSINPNNVIAGSDVLIPSPSLWPVFGPIVVEEEDTAAEDEAAEEEAGTQEEHAGDSEEAGEDGETADDEGLAEEAQPTGEGEGESGADTDETSDEGDDSDEANDAGDTEGSEGEEATPEPGNGQPQMTTSRSGAGNPSVPEIQDQFAAGYIAGGGPPQHLDRILSKVIPCESGYNLRAYNPAGPFYGLMQFLPQTWANLGGGDWADPYQQGYNTALLLRQSSPTSQWPHCWR